MPVQTIEKRDTKRGVEIQQTPETLDSAIVLSVEPLTTEEMSLTPVVKADVKSSKTVVVANPAVAVSPKTASEHFQAAGKHLNLALNPESPAKEVGRFSYAFYKRLLSVPANLLKAVWDFGKGVVASIKSGFNYVMHRRHEGQKKEAFNKIMEAGHKATPDIEAAESHAETLVTHVQSSEKHKAQAIKDIQWAGNSVLEVGGDLIETGKNAIFTVGNGIGAVYYTGNGVVRSLYNEGVVGSICSIPGAGYNAAEGFLTELTTDITSCFAKPAVVEAINEDESIKAITIAFDATKNVAKDAAPNKLESADIASKVAALSDASIATSVNPALRVTAK